ncbi:MAG: DUF438 domain-containing protein [Candidatus Thorarchaeota archaeon]
MKQSDKKKTLGKVIKRLHEGDDPEDVKAEFSDLLQKATPREIAMAEEELIQEGLPRERIQKLCDIHLELFKESLDSDRELAPSGHPINILMEEHRQVLETLSKMGDLGSSLVQGTINEEEMSEFLHMIHHLEDSEKHYLREENVLFPYLEKHGVKEPPAIMWSEHDHIRDLEKELFGLVSENRQVLLDNSDRIKELSDELSEFVRGHFDKENNILFPTAMEIMEDTEWHEIRTEFDEIGYCCFTPEVEDYTAPKPTVEKEPKAPEGMVKFETGNLTFGEIQGIFNSLPVDITFVDKDDRVRFFSESGERIFVRSKAVIGREVQNCHPKKSVHVVNKILEDFKNNERDSAKFWINLGERLIYIRYFAVRNASDEYLGCLEVTQDITKVKEIEGQKRLLD